MLDPIGFDEERSVALAVDRDDKHSFYALQWTTDVLLSKDQTLTLIHVHQPKPIPNGNSDFSDGQDPDDQCTDVFLPYRVFCSSREVSCDTVILEDQDIGKALIDYVSLYRVQILVLGTQSKSKSKRAIPRKLFNIKGDLASTVMKGAPGYCSVYTIAKGNKIAFAREASHPLKWSLEKMHNIPQRKLITSASYMCRSRTQDEVIQARLSTDLSSYTCSHGRLSTDNAFLGLYQNLRSDLLWSDNNNNNNNNNKNNNNNNNNNADDDDLAWSEWGNCSPPRASNFSRTKGFNFTRGLVDSQMNSVDIDGTHFSNEEESRPNSFPSSPTTDDEMGEMRRKLELETNQTMEMYHQACKQAVQEKQKAKELQILCKEIENKLREAEREKEEALAMFEKTKEVENLYKEMAEKMKDAEREKEEAVAMAAEERAMRMAATEEMKAAKRAAEREKKRRKETERNITAIREAEANKIIVLSSLAQSHQVPNKSQNLLKIFIVFIVFYFYFF